MKAVILAGGKGTRIAEETVTRPKPMVEIGGRPLLWHLMSIYAAQGVNDFVVACGYRGEFIKEYFASFFLHHSDFTINLKDGTRDLLGASAPDWRVSVVDTGLETMTGGRIRRLRPLLQGETFMATYGDGLGAVDLRALLAFHRAHGRIATVTAVRPPARFGNLAIEGDRVREFAEKPQTGEGWINGGFFVFEPALFDYIADDTTSLEQGPLERIAAEGQLMAFRHEGFWQPMDTVRERQLLESLWASGDAPWKLW
ncbi:MAG: glucose-1-phosphate cytidylyltransferase [Vicinamibacterales bacterium]